MEESQFNTPMMRQYLALKKQYGECILFFRMGDFYEMFLDDAEVGAKILDITLTSRTKAKEGRIPMAGVPYHAADGYIAKLIQAGRKVAIAEQVSDPKAPGLVERKVVRIVTPGTIMDGEALDRRRANYVIALRFKSGKVGLARMEVSTGEFETISFDPGEKYGRLFDELARINPAECILTSEDYNDQDLLGYLSAGSDMNIFPYHDFVLQEKEAVKTILAVTSVPSLDILGFKEKDDSVALEAAASLWKYVAYTLQEEVPHIRTLKRYQASEFMLLDRSTILNLELFATLREGERKGSFVHLLDETVTAMGARLLRAWIRNPLLVASKIHVRHELVDLLVHESELRKFFKEGLELVHDVERLIARLATGMGNARDLVSLAQSLEAAMGLKKNWQSMVSKGSQKVIDLLEKEIFNDVDETMRILVTLIGEKIVPEPPVDVRSGKMIAAGVNTELDRLREIHGGGKDWIVKIEQRERSRTGIGSLKIRFNRVFGFYIEISKTNLHLVPSDYIRKQTLVNAERFVTEDLKVYEEQVLTAEEKINELEYQLFREIVGTTMEYIPQIQSTGQSIGTLDCVVNFAHLAEKYDYSRPEMVHTAELSIRQGRHPVVEYLLGPGAFVPNDIELHGDTGPTLLMVTGPNMAGKSVYIRQAAMICLMAQLGSFVPATSARLPIVDRIFVRSGASDAMSRGLSTFMIEMMETAHILRNATRQSLIVMDEIGRGTSTYDGISIAWAVAEALATEIDQLPDKTSQKNKQTIIGGPWVLFATHYHELQQLADNFTRIENMQVVVEQRDGEPVFLHAVVRGGASASFGVAVAKLAGVPLPVVTRAEEILKSLESGANKNSASSTNASKATSTKKGLPVLPIRAAQLGWLESDEPAVLQQLRELDVERITPLEALAKLAELKKGV